MTIFVAVVAVDDITAAVAGRRLQARLNAGRSKRVHAVLRVQDQDGNVLWKPDVEPRLTPRLPRGGGRR